MAEKQLTDRKCMAAKILEGEVLLADGGNLYLRIRPTSKDWLFIYRFGVDGKRRKLGLGNYPDTSLAGARVRASECRNLLSGGTDPHAHRETQVAAVVVRDALPQTVTELFEDWMKKDLRRRRVDGGAEVERQFKKDVLPEIGTVPLASLRRAHITHLLDNVAKRGVTRTVGIVLADLRQMFAFALIREMIPSDPTIGLKKASWGGLAQERDRVLSDSEIRQLAMALPEAGMVPSGQYAIWIMLSTLARVGELSQTKWTDINFDDNVWTVPKEITKTKKEHVVDLSAFAVRQFTELKALSSAEAEKHERQLSEYVFPAARHMGHVCEKSLTKRIGDRQRGDKRPLSGRSPHTNSLMLPGGKWTSHDLRRTGATMMGDLGVRPDVIEKCLNHVEPNRIKRIYQRQTLRPEMREAWKVLGEHLELLNTVGSNVLLGKFGKA
ncbi:MAG: integrase arm-type DNA-binding domain-containing protein [Sterolibacterium sp.]|jgi:integrase